MLQGRGSKKGRGLSALPTISYPRCRLQGGLSKALSVLEQGEVLGVFQEGGI